MPPAPPTARRPPPPASAPAVWLGLSHKVAVVPTTNKFEALAEFSLDSDGFGAAPVPAFISNPRCSPPRRAHWSDDLALAAPAASSALPTEIAPAGDDRHSSAAAGPWSASTSALATENCIVEPPASSADASLTEQFPLELHEGPLPSAGLPIASGPVGRRLRCGGDRVRFHTACTDSWHQRTGVVVEFDDDGDPQINFGQHGIHCFVLRDVVIETDCRST